MIQSKSAGHAKAYFSDALSKSDYFVSDQELAGFWQGKLAERLGLSGETTKEDFYALCENQHPKSGDHLTPRTKENRTTGYDINFHCPKSVSVMHVFSKDDHILEAFKESVSETMRAIERDSKTRVRLEGQYDERSTGELAWGHFVHQTARPVEGQLPDPHLHSHCFVFNATWDATESRVKAAQFREINRDMPFYQAQFHKILSDKLVDLGYSIRRTSKSFEIDGVPRKVLDLFSKRTDEIGRAAKEKGITDAKELGELGARTRSKKQKGSNMHDLKKEWKDQVGALDKDGTEEETVRFAPVKEASQRTAEHCIDHAVSHCFERASVMADRRLLAVAYRHAVGAQGASVESITQAFEEDKRIIHVKDGSQQKCTTLEVLREEEVMVNLAKRGKAVLTPTYSTSPQIELQGEQGAAVHHVLTTNHRVSIVRGAAGTGKTTLMKEAERHYNAAGKQMVVVAPTAQASRGVLKDEGFASATTVANLIAEKELQKQLQGQVLWVDEAGLLGTKDTTALLRIAEAANAQLVLGGDTRQHASVVRGDALRILNTVAGIIPAEVSKIYRQTREEYKAAVEDLSKGNIANGFTKLENIGFIKSMETTEINAALVSDYVDVIKRGKEALIISPTHKQGEAITQSIRERLRDEGFVGKKEIETKRLKNLNLTEAEKSDTRNFENGNIIQFNQNVKGFSRGSVWTVEKSDNNVFLKNGSGESKPLPVIDSKRFDVFEEQMIKLSKGDKILITHNGVDRIGKRLDNGEILEVMKATKNGIELQNVRSKCTHRLDENFRHFAYAHYVTSYASQGKSVNEVFIYQPASTFAATDAKQFYVSVSRGKDKAHIYTDDKTELLHHAQLEGNRTSAIELFSSKAKVFERQQQTVDQELINNVKRERDYEPDK